MRSDLHEANRLSWNAATRAHNSHKADQAAFFRNGGSTLYPEELQLLGHLDGLRLLHLQCNAGQDSLSLARLGAHVTGSTSPTAPSTSPASCPVTAASPPTSSATTSSAGCPSPPPAANASNGSSPPTARWSGSPTSSAGPTASPRCWFPAGASSWWSSILSPCTSTHTGNRPTTTSSREPIAESGVSDYVAESGASLAPSGYRAGVENFSNPHPSYEFQWGLADVIGALLGAGLQLERLEEYPYANGWAGFDGMRDGGGGRMLPPADRPRLPLMYGLSARKPR